MSKNNIAKLRKNKKLTQKQLAECIEVSESTIAMYETGKRIPPLNKAKKIADFFEVTIESIFFIHSTHA